MWALRFVESRRATKRRFGPDADATWTAFRDDFGTSARIDLLLRDADTQWPGAFGARSVYGLAAVAEDEAFGAAWMPLDDVDAEDCGGGSSPHVAAPTPEERSRSTGPRCEGLGHRAVHRERRRDRRGRQAPGRRAFGDRGHHRGLRAGQGSRLARAHGELLVQHHRPGRIARDCTSRLAEQRPTLDDVETEVGKIVT